MRVEIWDILTLFLQYTFSPKQTKLQTSPLLRPIRLRTRTVTWSSGVSFLRKSLDVDVQMDEKIGPELSRVTKLYKGSTRAAQTHLVAAYWLRLSGFDKHKVEVSVLTIIAKYVPFVNF